MTEANAVPPKFVLFHGPEFPADDLAAALDDKSIVLRPADTLGDDIDAATNPAAILVDRSMAMATGDAEPIHDHLVVIAMDADAEGVLGEAADVSIAHVPDVRGRLSSVRTAFRLSAERLGCARAWRELGQSQLELQELNRIGMALMTEHDRRALLRQILNQAMSLTVSDVGVLFLSVQAEGGDRRLLFKRMFCRSVTLPAYRGVTVPIDSSSTAGYAALTGKTLVHDDIHNLPPGTPYKAHSIATDTPNYWIKSMLTIPMIGQAGQVVGVLLLGNRRRDASSRIEGKADAERYVISYSERDVQLGTSLAGQAAIAIENVQLMDQIEQVFERFVKASVMAIDQRDPTTAGHSIRVAMLTGDIAAALEHVDKGPYRDVRLSEIELRELHYAALLHDFGKIGVRENVLMKAKKLPVWMGERIESRFDLIRCTMQLEYERARSNAFKSGSSAAELEELEARYRDRVAELDWTLATIRDANEPAILPVDVAEVLTDIAALKFERSDGSIEPYIRPDELHYLAVPLGSLDEHERLEVQSHAARTFEYLSHIPWTDGYQNIPRYAAAHHEKLNGSGYPRHLTATEIPVQTRIITIADIFDALTASDRPYKRAVSPDIALDIIRAETDAGMLDPDLVRIMIDGQLYRRVLEEDWRNY